MYLSMTHPSQAHALASKTPDLQDAFLIAFAKLGNISEAAHSIGLSHEAPRWWVQHDSHGFRARFQAAQVQFAEYLEQLARQRVEAPTNNGRTGSDVLLIAMLNANHPTKWRRDTVIVGGDTTRQLIEAITKLASRQQPQVVEGAVTAQEQVAKMLGSGDGKAPSQE